MKTGYVYIVALRGKGLWRFARVLRLCVSLRHPHDRVRRLEQGVWRARNPILVDYAFVEDLIGARGHIKAALKRFRCGPRGRTFACLKTMARRALEGAAARQTALRAGRFHPRTGLLTDPQIEIAGPVAALARHIAAVVEAETQGDLARIDTFLHPYMIGTIASVFHHTQKHSKIPDAYFSEIVRDIAWRSWKCRLKPEFFIAIAQRTREQQKYLELARYRFETGLKTRTRPQIPEAQLAAFLRQPTQHLRETVASYVDTLEHSPKLRWRRILFAIARFAIALGAVMICETQLAGGSMENWVFALVTLFLAGGTILAFNLYETPDLTRGIGFLTAREAAQELARLRQKSDPAPSVSRAHDAILRVA